MMKLKDFKPDLIDRLRDGSYANAYLARVLEENEPDAYCLAIRNVAEAMSDDPIQD